MSAAGARPLLPVLLSDSSGTKRQMLTGLALLFVREGLRPRTPRTALVRVISHCLRTSGDSAAVPMDD